MRALSNSAHSSRFSPREDRPEGRSDGSEKMLIPMVTSRSFGECKLLKTSMAHLSWRFMLPPDLGFQINEVRCTQSDGERTRKKLWTM